MTQLPLWRVHIGTAGITCVRFALAALRDADPWPLSRVVAEVTTAGATRADRPHAAGSGRGMPIIHRQAMEWNGCMLHLEAHRLADVAEVSMELPSWDELAAQVADEAAVWDVIDSVAAACDARWGALGDGEALGDVPDLLRHTAVLVPERDSESFGITHAYTLLPKSGLAVLLR